MPRAHERIATGLAAGAVCCLAGAFAAGQTPEPSAEGDGLVHVSLTLNGQAISIAHPPDLSAADADHRALLAGTVGARAEIGTFEGHRALRIGSLAPDVEAIRAAYAAAAERAARAAAEEAEEGEEAEGAENARDAEAADAEDASARDAGAEGEETEEAESPGPALWLVRDAQGWQLEIHVAADEDAADADSGGQTADSQAAEVQAAEGGRVHVVPLSHREAGAAAPVLSASLHATAAEEGRLALRWGGHIWSADFRFDELPRPPRRPRVSGRGQAREAETDTSQIARSNMLSERNETALVLPDGARIAMVYWKGIAVEDEDYGALPETADGNVVRLIRAPALRLMSDVPLRFGATEVPIGNLAPGFAGLYGVWLRKAGDGWRFVFNNEPDSWGTQHDPAFDVAEIAADYSRTAGSFRPLGATVVPRGGDQARLVVHWGPHEWAADFAVAR